MSLLAAIPYIAQGLNSIMGGNAQKKAGKATAALELQASKDIARNIRRAAAEARSTASASYAASGVDVGSGSPLITDQKIITDSEYDAINALLTGKARAKAAKAGGSAAAQGSALSAGGSFYSGWITARDKTGGT